MFILFLFAAVFPEALTVDIQTKNGYATGTLINKKVDGVDTSFVLTAAHVVDDCEEHPKILGPLPLWRSESDILIYIPYNDFAVLQCKIYLPTYSEAPIFYTGKLTSKTLLVDYAKKDKHYGVVNNSLTLSRHQMLDMYVYPGYSGSGVFTKEDHYYVGMMLSRNLKYPNLSYMLPAYEIVEIARKNNIMWLVNNEAEVTQKELDGIKLIGAPLYKDEVAFRLLLPYYIVAISILLIIAVYNRKRRTI